MIKCKERALRISVTYEPYRMGSKFFIIFKFIGIHKSLLSLESNGDHKYVEDNKE